MILQFIIDFELASNPVFQELADNDSKIIFLKIVSKINNKNKAQDRILAITQFGIYNYKLGGAKYQRKIDINKLSAISINIFPDNDELVLHVDSEYDYRYTTNYRKDIINILKERYFMLCSKNLPIYEIEEKYLTKYMKTENMKGQQNLRSTLTPLPDEAIYFESFGINGDIDFSTFELLYSRSSEEGKNSLDGLKQVERKSENLYGEEDLVSTSTGELFIMKVIPQANILNSRQITYELVKNEIMINLENEFLIHPEFIYINAKGLYVFHKFFYETTLEEKLKNAKRLNENLIKFYGYQIASALDYLHSKGIVYGDLNTSKILVNKDGYICLNDFGAYRLLKSDTKKMYQEDKYEKYFNWSYWWDCRL